MCLQDPDDSANIVRTYSSFYFRSHLCITFQLLSLNLYEYIKACNFQVSQNAHNAAWAIITAIHFYLWLHSLMHSLISQNEKLPFQSSQGSSLTVIRRVAHQVLQCLKFLLDQNIVHCDLKPENILLIERGRTGIKVSEQLQLCLETKWLNV